MLSRRTCLLAPAAALPWATQAEPVQPLRYARFSAGDDPRVRFPLDLLRLVLGPTTPLMPSELVMERTRAIKALEAGDLDLIWISMGQEVEQVLRPIRIPIYRGLIGQRLFLIHRDRAADFAQVRRLSDLAAFTAGQGVGWVDTQILQSAGLKVVTNTYDALFKMLARGSVDYFPRGANEALAEQRARASEYPELIVEPRLLLSYRSDNIFFVSKKNEALAQRLEGGLLAAHADGSYQQLYDRHPYVQQVLADANLGRRLRMEIPNPILSDEDRRIPDRFWM